METSSFDVLRSLSDFWALVVDVWQKGLWGISVGQISAAIFTLAIFVLARNLFSRIAIKRLRNFASRSKFHFPGSAMDALEGPLRLIPIVLGVYFAFALLPLDNDLALFSNRFVRSLVVITIFWGLHNLVSPLSFLLGRVQAIFTPEIVEWLLKATRILFIAIGAATVLDIWGIQIAPILAGLGLIGVAVALGAQDLFKNLIGGILILVEKRFSRGDWILIEDMVEGVVEHIGFRSTVVRRFDKAPVFVPNARFADSPVINFSQMSHRRIYWKIGVLYSTTIVQLREIRDGIEKYILENSDQFASPSEVSTFVRIDSFNDSSIDIMVYCFTRTTEWGEWLKIKENLAYHVKNIVENAGSGFAFPSRSLYLEMPTGEVAELFVPPDGKN